MVILRTKPMAHGLPLKLDSYSAGQVIFAFVEPKG